MCEVVIGIDFVSPGTGYTYSFNNPKDIEIGYFSEKGRDTKVPTEIILDKNLNILAFGEECNEYISSNQLKF